MIVIAYRQYTYKFKQVTICKHLRVNSRPRHPPSLNSRGVSDGVQLVQPPAPAPALLLLLPDAHGGGAAVVGLFAVALGRLYWLLWLYVVIGVSLGIRVTMNCCNTIACIYPKKNYINNFA